jgi:molybdenum cofactor guanylyltransferase
MGGQDKGLMNFDGQPIASRVVGRLQPQVGSLLINANRNLNAWQAYGVPVVSDVIGGFSGPLAGIHAGLTVCKTPWLLTVPCDSPFLPVDLVERLANGVQLENADIAVARCAGRLQPVFVLLRTALLPALEKHLQAGGRKIESWIESLNRVIVDFDTPDSFININTLDELAHVLRDHTAPVSETGSTKDVALAPTRSDDSLWKHQSVLIVDDEPGMLSFLERSLASRCAIVATAPNVNDAEQMLTRQHFDLIVLDISLPGRSGVQWLHQLREQGFLGDVVLMTAYADLDTAIDALRAGAADFLLKPFSVAQMLNAVKRCFERSSLLRENFVLRRQIAQRGGALKGLIGHSSAMNELCQLLRRIAPTPSTVLIQGESGTGKELAARALHHMSTRSDQPFVPINCAAISAELIESELFGHVKGAYTGATSGREGMFYYARGGTLFLDEVSELPLALQAKLLRVLEEKRIRPVGTEQEVAVDVRMIVATNRNLAAEVAEGRFRQDLYYRLQVVELNMPPLRDRLEDVPELVQFFVDRLAPSLGVQPLPRDDGALARMARYAWPGNVRELRNLIERSLILGYYADDFVFTYPGDRVSAESVEPAESLSAAVPDVLKDDELLDEVERRHSLAVLANCAGNKTEAARRLGVSRKTLERKCVLWNAR